MRVFEINPNYEKSGWTSRVLSIGMINSAPVIAWNHFFHEPYANDWRRANVKARLRKNA